ncbi:Glycosyl transferase, group 1 [Dehalobacter sp. UNSWDHB]|uniref:glycosyltransferase family 4 protein n=1 Tax=Dehalobacter sp. UNSWDHB TaxID=1339256 RepID=UPI0003877B94|nr:glycosyltransferase [Dehalobacter sp. UNSWDHB]EQB22658.1 Glycosyl transferase, group 1 [Dehalobacter sp. UNSWDHB]
MNKKIIFVIPVIKDLAGGAERVISILANHAAENGDSVILITLAECQKAYTLKDNISCISLKDKENSVAKLLVFIDIIKRTKCDIIISFLPGAILFSIIAGKICGTKVIACERNDPRHSVGRNITKVLRNLLYRYADGFVFQTEEAKTFFSNKIQKRSIIIPNPLSENIIEPFLGNRTNEVVSAGKFFYQKNHILLLEAFSDVEKIHPELSLTIYGEGSLRIQYENKIRELGIESKVNLPGRVSDIHERISKSKMFVLSSDYEGISNSLLEALALGLPTISTDCPCGGSRMFIINGVNGLLVPVGDRKALADAMLRLIDDKALCESLSRNSIMIREKLQVKKIYQIWDKYINDIILE